MRTFHDAPAVRSQVPLLLGLVGASSSGKTFSALRLAAGMQRVIGGDVFFIDTEARRAAHYADRFRFRHVEFNPPFGPLDYLAAIEHCVSKGAKILVVDSMTHEHAGPGGVMDQSEAFLESKCGDDWKARERMQMLSFVKPKQQRKKLNAAIVQMGINAIFCYRAQEKIKPVRGGEPLKLGWQPETTSPLHYDMTARFLLPPGSDGYPSFLPETDTEKLMVKLPDQFRELLKGKVQLSEDIGEQLARWAAGSAAPAGDAGPSIAVLLTGYESCGTQEAFAALESERSKLWPKIKAGEKAKLKAASEAASKRLAEPATANPDADQGDDYRPPEPGEMFAGSGKPAH